MLGRSYAESYHPLHEHPSRSPSSASYSSATGQQQASLPKQGIYKSNASGGDNPDHRSHQDDDNNNNNNTVDRDRKHVRKSNRKRHKRAKKTASVAPLSNGNDSHAPDKYAARELYVSLRCQWKIKHQQRTLHRVVMVNWDRNVVYDKPVRDLKSMKIKMAPFFNGKVIIGHGLEDCWDILGLQQHGWVNVRDCAHYYPFMQPQQSINSICSVEENGSNVTMVPRTLEDLAAAYFHRNIADVNDPLVAQARTAMDLYRSVRTAWETEITELWRHQSMMNTAPYQYENTNDTATEQLYRENLEYSPSSIPGDAFGPEPADLHQLVQKGLDLNSDASHEEELSTVAPTEPTLECDSVYSHTVSDSTNSIISETSIWRPADECSPSHNTSKNKTQRHSTASFGWGLWLSRPVTAISNSSYQAKDASHHGCLEEEDDNDDRVQDDALNAEQEFEWPGAVPEERGLLPHHLLDESFDDAEDEVPPQEASNHPIDGSDWLEPAPKREMSWFARLRRSPDGRKEYPSNAIGNDIGHDCGEQQSHPLEGVVDLNIRSNAKPSWFPRLKRSTTPVAAPAAPPAVVENSGASASDPSRSDGEASFNRSTHSCDDYWLLDEKNLQVRFSFFRRKSFTLDNSPSVAEKNAVSQSCPDDVVQN